MKKIQMKLDGVKNMLSKEDMKKISGGYTDCCACFTDGYMEPIIKHDPSTQSCDTVCKNHGYGYGFTTSGGC